MALPLLLIALATIALILHILFTHILVAFPVSNNVHAAIALVVSLLTLFFFFYH